MSNGDGEGAFARKHHGKSQSHVVSLKQIPYAVECKQRNVTTVGEPQRLLALLVAHHVGCDGGDLCYEAPNIAL